MKIIDARSGKEIKPGETVTHVDGSSTSLIAADHETIMTVELMGTTRYRSPDTGKMITSSWFRRAPIRFMHPDFLFQRVAFIES